MSAPTLDDLRKLVARTEGAAPSHMNASTIRELRAAAAWALGRIEELEGKRDLILSGLNEAKMVLDDPESDPAEQVRHAWDAIAETLTTLNAVEPAAGGYVDWPTRREMGVDAPDFGPTLGGGDDA